MRLVNINLQAFGLFTDVPINFDVEEQDFHVIYGPNEAGKSSTLRAIKSLLYGIPRNTKDNFKHQNNNIRIGGTLRNSDGTEAVFIRKKGIKNTILDLEGNLLNDLDLNLFIHGVEENFFSTMFGINHKQLVDGGSEILEGKGEVGQSLYQASLGGVNIRKILQGLNEEAGKLFKKSGSSPAINKSIKEFGQAKKTRLSLSLSSKDWIDLNESWKKHLEERDELNTKLINLRTSKDQMERLKKILPKIVEREQLAAKLGELGEGVILTDEFTEKRREAVSTYEHAVEMVSSSTSELEDLRKEVLEIPNQEGLLVKSESITEMHARMGSNRQARNDLRELEAKRSQLISDAIIMLKDISPSHTLDNANELRPSSAFKVRVHSMSAQYEALVGSLEISNNNVQKFGGELNVAEETFKTLKPIINTSELRSVVTQIQKQGDLESTLQDLTSELNADEEDCHIELNRLGQWKGTIEELEKVSIPSEKTIDRFESTLSELLTVKDSLEQQINQVKLSLNQLETDYKELRLAGEIPTEIELSTARIKRDEAWQHIRRIWIDGVDITQEGTVYDSDKSLSETYEKQVTIADEIVDHLRREADRVATKANLQIQKAKLSDDLMKLEKDIVNSQGELEETNIEWASLWEPSGINPLPPKEMRLWRINYSKLLERAERVRKYRNDSESIKHKIQSYKNNLKQAACNVGESLQDHSINILLNHCSSLVDDLEKSSRDYKELKNKIITNQKDLKTAQVILNESQVKLGEWKADWKECMNLLRLEEHTLPTEAQVALAKLDEIFKKRDEADSYKMRIIDIEKEANLFSKDVDDLVQLISPDLGSLLPIDAVNQLNNSLSKARGEAVKLSELNKQIKDKEKILQNAQNKRQLMKERLNVLCKQAGCSEHKELETKERLSKERHETKNNLKNNGKQIVELGMWKTLEEILIEAQEIDINTLPSQIAENELQIKDAEKQLSELEQAIGSDKNRLNQMDGLSKAADYAEIAQSHLSEIHSGVDRYLKLRLAHIILQEEIEKFREQNQEPLLRRASEIFSKLTNGSFSKLQTDFDDNEKPILLGIRPNNESVRVEGMSDGSLDQLYLSLRLSSLESYLESNEPMPFIVDDILIKFDDNRALATLEVLAELSKKTQVLFFTHHATLVELAKTIDGIGGHNIHMLNTKSFSP